MESSAYAEPDQRPRRRGRGHGGHRHGARSARESDASWNDYESEAPTADDLPPEPDQRTVEFTPAPPHWPMGVKIGLWLLALGAAALATQVPVVIRPGERGVLVTTGKVQPEVLAEGTHFIVPFWQHVDRGSVLSANTVQEVDALTKDRLPVHVRMAVEFRPDSRELPNILRETGFGSLDTKVVIPALLAVPDTVVGQRSAEAILDRRPEAMDAVRSLVAERVAKRGVKIEVFDVAFSFPPETLNAVAAQKAETKRLADEAAKTAAAGPVAPAPPAKKAT